METLRSKDLAQMVGASLRQIQHWTDIGILECAPGTDRGGRGSQRLYARDEVGIAALIAAMNDIQLPSSVLKNAAAQLRIATFKLDYSVFEYYPEWAETVQNEIEYIRPFLFGKKESVICIDMKKIKSNDEGALRDAVMWREWKDVSLIGREREALVILNVKPIVERAFSHLE